MEEKNNMQEAQKEENHEYEEYVDYDKTLLQRLWGKIMRSNDNDNDEDSLRIAAGIILCAGMIFALYLLFTQSFIKTSQYFDEHEFYFPGFITAIATGFSSIVTFYFLRVIANISDRLKK